jgi:hypothetical protein
MNKIKTELKGYLVTWIVNDAELRYQKVATLKEVESLIAEIFDFNQDEVGILNEVIVVNFMNGKVTHPTVKLQPLITWNELE